MELATEEHKAAIEAYVHAASMKSSVDRLQEKEKTGEFTGAYAINPLNGAKVPILDFRLRSSGLRNRCHHVRTGP